MFWTYLGRELGNRRRQTAIIAIGIGIGIALVIVVNAAAAGVRVAQATALQSVYGVGTDITVTKAVTAAAPNGGGQQFRFGAGGGGRRSRTRALNGSALRPVRGAAPFAVSSVAAVQHTAGVKAATGALDLRNVAFTGQVPAQQGQGSAGGSGAGGGGSAFGVDSFSVLGYDAGGPAIGPLTAAALTKGRALDASDGGMDVAVLDSSYATSTGKAVGGSISIGGKSFTIVGIVTSTAATGSSAADAYIPLDTAQTLAGQSGKVSDIYVQATSAAQIPAVKTALQTALGPSVTVNTEADLASTVTGSLGTAASLADSLGLWLSVLVLAAAFLIAVLFTVAGVTRRTRELGTLKAVGWSNRRIVGQIAGESLVQGLIGGALGILLGIAAISAVNLIHPTLTARTVAVARAAGRIRGAGGGGGLGRSASGAGHAAAQIALSLPLSGTVIALAVALAVLGGLIAGAFGGWRAARLRPAAALRAIA
ncbi:MAG TPA: ABC transporter permease [Amnibacterium sp.]|uniref:ABC transporter permease n=1 Tax=Amnibacterium sp. TaxID=1872496 RepID=UPI002F9518F6